MLIKALPRPVHCHSIWTRYHVRVAAVSALQLIALQDGHQIRNMRSKQSPAGPAKASSKTLPDKAPSAPRKIPLPSAQASTSIPRKMIPIEARPAAYTRRPTTSSSERAGENMSDEEIKRDTLARDLLAEQDEVLIYRATSHASLLISSILAGTTFAAPIIATVTMLMNGGSSSWLFQAPVYIIGAIGMSMSVVMLTVTLNQINMIKLVKLPNKTFALRFEPKWRMYFWQPRAIVAPFNKVLMDGNIRDTVERIYGVKKEDRFKWTRIENKRKFSYFINLRHWLRDSFMTLPSSIWRDVGRFGFRRGLMLVRVNGRLYKMDMWDAKLLDNGHTLHSFVYQDKNMQSSIIGMIRKSFSSA